MKPYPLAALNHFTVPFSFICVSFYAVMRMPYEILRLKSKRGLRLTCTGNPLKSLRKRNTRVKRGTDYNTPADSQTFDFAGKPRPCAIASAWALRLLPLDGAWRLMC